MTAPRPRWRIDRADLADAVGYAHGIEEFRLEHQPGVGVPSADIFCRCGQVTGFTEYGEHVAAKAIEAVSREISEGGTLE